MLKLAYLHPISLKSRGQNLSTCCNRELFMHVIVYVVLHNKWFWNIRRLRDLWDYRAFRYADVQDRYRNAYIQDTVANLEGARFLSKMGPFRAYHQIPIAINDIPDTEVGKPFGLRELLLISFGQRDSSRKLSTTHRSGDHKLRICLCMQRWHVGHKWIRRRPQWSPTSIIRTFGELYHVHHCSRNSRLYGNSAMHRPVRG